MRSLLTLAAAVFALAAPTTAIAAVDQGGTPPARDQSRIGNTQSSQNDLVLVRSGKKRIHSLTKSWANDRHAHAFLVWTCGHPVEGGARQVGVVECKVRLQFRDPVDGATVTERWIGYATTSRTGFRKPGEPRK